MGFRYNEEIDFPKIVENPEEKVVISLICLADDWKSFSKQNANTIKDFVNWIRKLEDITVQEFVSRSREKWWFIKEQEKQPNYKFLKWLSKTFKNHKIRTVEIQCYKNSNYWHCHVDNNKSGKLIRVFGILVSNKFCILEIDWNWKRNH